MTTDPEGQQHDTVRNYSGAQTALSQEAVLQQIVAMMRLHKSEYVVLRSSNPIDQLFLSHFLRLAYPEGRIVMLGSDLLLGRETGSSSLNGIMTLSTYPLVPWEPHWTRSYDDPVSRSHRVFAHDSAEGTYIATRSLLRRYPFGQASQGNRTPTFLPLNCVKGFVIPDYAAPFWTGEGVDRHACRQPSTWLAVLGRGGFWPLAALNDATLPHPEDKDANAASNTDQSNPLPIPQVGNFTRLVLPWLDKPAYHLAEGKGWPGGIWPKMPLGMKILLASLLVLSVFHFMSCARASITVKPCHRAHFVTLAKASHSHLIVIGSVVLGALGTVVAESIRADGVRFFENGIVSLNFRVADEAVRARASRTTHPVFLHLMQTLCRKITGRVFAVDDPYIYKTKTEVTATLADNQAVRFISQTCSCSHPMFQPKAQWHCGKCSQCIDRRFAIMGAGLSAYDSETDYVTDVFVGPRKEGPEKAMAVDYIRHGIELAVGTEEKLAVQFNAELSRAVRYEPKRSEAAAKIIGMHKRHGEVVNDVLRARIAEHAESVIAGTLEKGSLLALVIGGTHLRRQDKDRQMTWSSAPANERERIVTDPEP